jgi:tetratricopeptide (TPR) repeat protein
MASIDKKYLKTQFRLKVYQKSATEFQTFFEDIMQEALPDFQKVRPYGSRGDEGNDGYRPKEGIYYQVYAPEKPGEREAEAAAKLKRDFEKLKKTWDKISEIKTFYFVFNDKGSRVTIPIEEALADLRVSNPGIEFKLFLPKDLEAIFFTLQEDSILSLGFDIDSRNTLRICRENLAALEVHLDRGRGLFVLESLQDSQEITARQNDDSISADWEIMQCRALQQLERVEEARQKYESLGKRYQNDPRPLLHLAEIYFAAENYGKANDLLQEAEKIDDNHWLLRLIKLLRDLRLGIEIDVTSIDERSFPTDPEEKSSFYRLYATILLRQGDLIRAESFIERAIHLNPDRLANYIVKLAVLEHRLFSQAGGDIEARKAAEKLLSELEVILDKIGQWGPVSPRHQAVFNLGRFKPLRIQEKFPELESLAKETFALLLDCYFDLQTDYLLAQLLMSVALPPEELDKLLSFLRGAEKGLSDYLAKALLFQFVQKNTVMTEGRTFFKDAKKENILGVITSIENKDYDQLWHFMEDDLNFAIAMAHAAKEFPDVRKKIIEKLPDEDKLQDKLLLLLNYDEKNIDEAFEILKRLDFSSLKYFECNIILNVARQKKAWEFVILVANKLLPLEHDKQIALQLELELFNANLSLERLPEAIAIGENILSTRDKLAMLDEKNRESLLAQIIMSRLKRGEYAQAKTILENYPDIPKTFEFKLGVAAEVYLKNRDALKAVTAIVDGIKILKTPTPEQYSSLFFSLSQIDNMIPVSLDSLPAFEPESFVKFGGDERWYYVGDGEPLDAKKIPSSNERYAAFSGKTVGDKVVFEFKYSVSTEHVVEKILPVERYIFAQSVRYFNELAPEGNLEGVLMVAVPKTDSTIDTTNIEAVMKDTRTGRGEFFDRYCQENIPLALLAFSEGGLTNAIGVIQSEGRGFVRCSSGDPAEISQQKEAATKVIDGEPFYMDGTSALILSENGLLAEIFSFLPNIMVPQSVITLLLDCKEKFRYIPGQSGRMQYVRGHLRFTEIDPGHGELIRKNFDKTLNFLESKPENIASISAANKDDSFIEQELPPEICDACILAQKDDSLVLTEDYLYLQANAATTGKSAPEYFSALALVRVLYERKIITFEKYLGFFSYLSSYRFRFLPITVNDIEKAVFGDGSIMVFTPERIRWFNFPLTLSTTYGVSFDSALRVVAIFLTRILTDDAVLPDMAERIFLEILSEFPTDRDKRSFGKLLLAVCTKAIERINKGIIVGTAAKNKLDRLSQLAEIYNAGNSLWTPPNS